MLLLAGRFVVLVCISAVLVVADVATDKPLNLIPVPDVASEKLTKSQPELAQRIENSEATSSPDKNSKIFSNSNVKENIDREIVVIHDQSTGGSGHHEHGHHDHHGHHEDHDHHEHHEHELNHPTPNRQPPPHHHHDHHHPPANYHHYPPTYPGYYPPHYPLYHHAVPPPMYPYYPSVPYYNSPPLKPSTTIIQTSAGGTTGQSLPKPTDLLNQGTEYLWNLFGKIGAATGENHEVVVIKPKPVPSQSVASMQMLPPGWYPNKGKVVTHVDCNNKKE